MSADNTPTQNNAGPPATNGGFDLNRPTIISLCYLGAFLTGITGLVGVVLGYIWKGEQQEAWMTSHYTYLIRTFWIGLVAGLIAIVLSFVAIGLLLFPLIAIWTGVRSVLSLVKAQRQEPMPDPETLLF